MTPVFRRTLRSLLLVGLFAAGVAAGALGWARYGLRPLTVRSGAFPEELVYVRSADNIVNAGIIFAPPKGQAKPVAIIWLHGWGVNFYSPTYVMIGRALAARGLTTIAVNTRMHDLGTVAGERSGKRIRGGGYWGVTSDGSLDLAAWVDFTAALGFERVVLVGHSAGWSAVAAYELQRHDPRVAGMVLASGAVQVQRPERGAALVAQATRLVSAGSGDELIRLPNRSFPSYISAGTLLDLANVPAAVLDFFGLEFSTPGIASLRKPLLAFFGTRESEVGGPADLDTVRTSVAKYAGGAMTVETAMIDKADHMYTGEEAQVAGVISDWVDRNVSGSGTKNNIKPPVEKMPHP
jgi:pimeloyl-ACP methyl ester carboxylesterase